MKTLILSGILDDNGKLQLHIPFTGEDSAPRPRSKATGDNVVEVDLLDKNDVVLSQTSIDAVLASIVPIDPNLPTPIKRQVGGLVTMPDETTCLRFRWRGGVIHEVRAPAGRPTVRFTWKPPADGVVSGSQHLTWNASHPDNVPMHFLVLTEGPEGNQEAVASIHAEPGELGLASRIDINAGYFPPGTVALVIIVSDGFHQMSDKSDPFTVGYGIDERA